MMGLCCVFGSVGLREKGCVCVSFVGATVPRPRVWEESAARVFPAFQGTCKGVRFLIVVCVRGVCADPGGGDRYASMGHEASMHHISL